MRILIISPHFPPSNAPDMQRVRLVLPYLGEAGIDAEVLAVEPEQVASPQDEWFKKGLPANVPIHRVKALGLKWAKIPGLGILSFRALGAIRRKGNELLAQGGFDLVYFSTTQFAIHVLGPEWHRRFGVPFVMDYQDPWITDYYRQHPEVIPPGGRLKHGIASWLARRQEPRVLSACSGITSVSAAYPRQLTDRYEWLQLTDARLPPSDLHASTSALRALPFLVLPFPGDARDFERVKHDGIRQSVYNPMDGLKHWVYVGVCPPSMVLAVEAIFTALSARKADSGSNITTMESLRLHFIGTSYAAAGTGKKIVEPLAEKYGMRGLVEEKTDRIPYSETLRCLLDADVLIVPGSDDPGYTASKIYPYLLALKPLLAVFHEKSSVVDLMRKVGGGSVVTFGQNDNGETIGRKIITEAFDDNGLLSSVALRREAFEPFTAEAQASALAAFFEICLGTESTPLGNRHD